MEYIVVTNNPLVMRVSLPLPADDWRIEPVTGNTEAVYDRLEELLQNGLQLVSSPLPANVPLIRSPVRSIILGKAPRRFDAEGLLAVAKARDRSAVLGCNDDSRVRKDLEMIDRDQLIRGFLQLRELINAECLFNCDVIDRNFSDEKL